MDTVLKVNKSEMNEANCVLNFQNMVEDTLKQMLAEDCHIEKKDTYKNNGVIYHGINVVHGNSRMGVNIYLDKYQEQYQAGRNYLEIIREILPQTMLYSRDEQEILEGTAEYIKSYDTVKEKIYCKLVNTNANQEFLKEIPSIPFLDLSIIFFVKVAEIGDSLGSVTVYNKQLNQWSVDKEILLEDALKNGDVITKKIGAAMKSVLEIEGNQEMLEELEEMEQMCKEEGIPEMLVASNEANHYGAYSMLCTEKLYEIAKEQDKNLFILPASVHETILVPDTEESEDKAMELSEMVKEVNATGLLKEEILSNSVYYFNRDRKEVILLIPGADI